MQFKLKQIISKRKHFKISFDKGNYSVKYQNNYLGTFTSKKLAERCRTIEALSNLIDTYKSQMIGRSNKKMSSYSIKNNSRLKLKELLQEANENYPLVFDKQLGLYTIKFSNGNVIIWDHSFNRFWSSNSKRPYLVGNNKSKVSMIRMNKVEVISYLKLNGVN